MNKALESLERLVMPDDLFLKECVKLGISNTYDYETIKKQLEAIDVVKKYIHIGITEIQNQKYLVIPNNDIRIPDSLVPISEEEYETLKGWFV